MIDIIIISVFGVFYCSILLFIYRTTSVGKYRSELLDKISEANHKDIEFMESKLELCATREEKEALLDDFRNMDFMWRFDVFQSVSFDEMVFQFWRKLDSF